MEKENLYSVLNLTKNASDKDIRESFRRLSLIHHPDKGGNITEFRKINEAYQILSDPVKRQMYDNPPLNPITFFQNIFNTMNNIREQLTKPVEEYVYYTSLEDLYRKMTVKLQIERKVFCPNNTRTKCDSCYGNGKFPEYKPGGNISIPTMKMCEKCNGTGTTVHTCDRCHGENLINSTDVVEFFLDRNTPDGHTIVFRDMGNIDSSGQVANLHVIIRYKPHPDFQLSQNNLITSRKISLKESLCGFNMSITHPSGEIININTTNITPHGFTKIIHGKGLTSNANMAVNFSVIYPEKLEKSVIEKLTEIL